MASNPLVSDRIDLLTVVTHELGHLLGHGHGRDEYDVMSALLSPGTRRLPEYDSINSQQVMSHMVDLSPFPAFARIDRVMSDDLDGDTLNARVTDADIDMCLPYLETPDYLERWQTIRLMKEYQIINDITDEETELLDEDLLELIVGENG